MSLVNYNTITDVENMTLDERQCLLASRAGTISYNAFAAEIIFHAVYAEVTNREDLDEVGGILFISLRKAVYQSAQKADLSAEEDSWVSKGESFYAYEDSNYVNRQEALFGEF